MLKTVLRKLRSLDRRSPFGVDVMTSLGSEFVKMGLATVAGIVLARQLGPVGRGEFAAVQSWAGFFAGVAHLYTSHSVVHLIGKAPREDGRWMGSALALSLTGGLPVVALGVFVLPLALGGERTGVVDAAVLYLVAFFLIQSTRLVWISALRGHRKLKHWNFLRVVATAGWLAAILLGVAIESVDAVWYVRAYLVMMAAVTVAVLVAGERHRNSPLSVDREGIHETAGFCLPLAAASIPQHLQNGARLGVLVVVALADPRAAGVFAVAAGWGRLLRPVTQALPAVVFPYVSGSETVESGAARIRIGVHVTTLLAVVFGVLLLAAAPIAVPLLYGSSFAAAVPPAIVLVAAGMMRAVGEAAEGGLRGLGHTGAVLQAELFGLVLGGGAMIPLVLEYGVMGAAVATLLGFGATAAAMVVVVLRTTDLEARELVPTTAEIRRLALWAWRETTGLWRDDETEEPG